jgi:hypothetical protein
MLDSQYWIVTWRLECHVSGEVRYETEVLIGHPVDTINGWIQPQKLVLVFALPITEAQFLAGSTQ